MAVGNITTTTAGVFLPNLWSVDILRATQSALVMASLVRRVDSQVQAYGQSLIIPNISNLTARSKAQNTSVTNDTITETSTTLNINQWQYIAFNVEDMAATQSKYDLRAEYAKSAGYGIAKKIDSDLMALTSGFSTTPVGTFGSNVDDAVIINAHAALDNADIPDEDRSMVISPGQKAAIMKIDKFTAATYLGRYQDPTPVVSGPKSRHLWGEIYGTPVYYTTNIGVTAGTPTQTNNMLIHKDAMVLGLQMAPRVQSQYVVSQLAWQVVTDTIYGVTNLRLDAGVLIRS